MSDVLDALKFDAAGLIPAVVQDHVNGQVLMVAYMNRLSLEKTISTGLCHYWSRSRGKLWFKGETSGHVQHVKQIRTDCDSDTLLIEVEQIGVACHDGYRSCFYKALDDGREKWQTIGTPEVDPKAVYGAGK